MLFQFWKSNTMIFLLQLIIGVGTYIETNSMLVVAVVCAVPAFLFGLVSESRAPAEKTFLSLSAGLAPIGLVLGDLPAPFTGIVVILVCIAGFAAASLVKGKDGSKVNLFLLFLTALPLGIGTIVGGGTLLYQRRMRRRPFIA